MTRQRDVHWFPLAKAITRGDLDDLGICHGCYGVIPGDPDVPQPCPLCGHFDLNDWEMVDDDPDS